MIDAVICDWNKTLFEDPYEDRFFSGLFRHVLAENLIRLNIKKVLSLANAGAQCRDAHKFSGNEANERIKDAVNILNENVIRGLPALFLTKYTEKFTDSAVNRVDKRLLDPLRELKISRGIKLGIISSGYNSGIKQILEKAGYIFDFLEANEFEVSGEIVMKFKLSIFDNKIGILKKLLFDNNIRRDNVIYIGDDMQDEECLKNVGYPVISFLAKSEYKDYFYKNLHAFVPKDEYEFDSYLRKIAN